MSILKIFFFHPPALHFALLSSGGLRLYLKLVLPEDLIHLVNKNRVMVMARVFVNGECMKHEELQITVLWIELCFTNSAWNMKNCKQLFFELNCGFWVFRTDHKCGRSLYLMGMHIYICSTRIHLTYHFILDWPMNQIYMHYAAKEKGATTPNTNYNEPKRF